MLWFDFFPPKMPSAVAVELNLKHRKLTNVVEQTHNVSTWSDCNMVPWVLRALAALQAATILVAMASEKIIGDQQIERETYLKNYQ